MSTDKNDDRKEQNEAANPEIKKKAAIAMSLVKQVGRLNQQHLHETGITVSN